MITSPLLSSIWLACRSWIGLFPPQRLSSIRPLRSTQVTFKPCCFWPMSNCWIIITSRPSLIAAKCTHWRRILMPRIRTPWSITLPHARLSVKAGCPTQQRNFRSSSLKNLRAPAPKLCAKSSPALKLTLVSAFPAFVFIASGTPKHSVPNKKAASFEAAGKSQDELSLEGQPSLHLQESSRYCRSDERTVRAGRRFHSRPNLTELAIADVRDRIGEVWMVEHVISVCAQTQTHALGNWDVLQQADIRVEVVRAAEGIPRNVPEVRFTP